MDLPLIGAIKITDGLFIGDEIAAQDLEFVVTNKVTHILNWAKSQVPSHWEPIGVRYMKLSWQDSDSQTLFDNKDETVNNIYDFIETGMNTGDSVLIHSVRGQARCCVVTIAWWMRRFQWSLFKCLEFINSRRPDLDLRPNFVQQLAGLENRFTRNGIGPKSANWQAMSNEEDQLEQILTNTYINAQVGDFEQYSEPIGQKSSSINWADAGSGEKDQLNDIHHPSAKNPVEDGYAIIRSWLKGASSTEHRVPIRRQQSSRTTKVASVRSSQIRKNIVAKNVKSHSPASTKNTADDMFRLLANVQSTAVGQAPVSEEKKSPVRQRPSTTKVQRVAKKDSPTRIINALKKAPSFVSPYALNANPNQVFITSNKPANKASRRPNTAPAKAVARRQAPLRGTTGQVKLSGIRGYSTGNSLWKIQEQLINMGNEISSEERKQHRRQQRPGQNRSRRSSGQSRQQRMSESQRMLLHQMMIQMQIPEEQLMQRIYRDSLTSHQAPAVSEASRIEVPFSVRKKSVKLTQLADLTKYTLSFATDAKWECWVVIHQAAMDVLDANGNSMYFYTDTSQFPAPQQFNLTPGENVVFPENIVILDTRVQNEQLLTHEYDQLYPLVVEVRAKDQTGVISQQSTFIYCKKKNNVYTAKVGIQKIKIMGVSYEQSEVFGLDNVEAFEQPDDIEQEWVICLSMPKTTMVMPCRHICMWEDCTNQFRGQSNQKCPVCREPVQNFISLKDKK